MKAYLQENRHNIILALATISICIGILVVFQVNTLKEQDDLVFIDNTVDEDGGIRYSKVFVDIQGAVNEPGVYEFEQGSIVADALNRAGGLREDADSEYISKHINRSKSLVNEEKIYIPATGEQASTELHTGVDTTGKININTATIQELDSLPGIGPSYAQKIIDARPFGSIEEIKNVPGIGAATFEKISDQISI